MRLGGVLVGLTVAVCCGALLSACSSGSSAPSTPTGNSVPLVSGGSPGSAQYLVYWDQNEEVDFLSMPSGTQGQLVPAVGPERADVRAAATAGSSVGYDPTLPAQDDVGSAKPYKQPADGMELDEPNGSFSGQDLYVPGPYQMPGQTIGSDSPPTANGVFNNNQTYTGCVVDQVRQRACQRHRHRPGPVPTPSSGRLVEWFAPSYTSYCIVYGPTSGGVRAPPHGRDRRARPARNDGPGRQRRPPRPQRRHVERAPFRRVIAAHQRIRVPGWDLSP